MEGYHRDTETCVREVVEASLKRLSARLGDILKRLSVLRGIFALDLAQGLTAEVTDAELRYLGNMKKRSPTTSNITTSVKKSAIGEGWQIL